MTKSFEASALCGAIAAGLSNRIEVAGDTGNLEVLYQEMQNIEEAYERGQITLERAVELRQDCRSYIQDNTK